MEWLLNHLEMPDWAPNEPLLDCASCQVLSPLKRAKQYSPKSKCCDFSPFISGFALGHQLSRGRDLTAFLAQPSLVWTVFGVVHAPEHRLASSKLCSFFKEGLCQIWEDRPAICFSFFCASQYRRGPVFYQELETKLLGFEAELVRLWFFERGGSASEWQLWGEYMEETPKTLKLPERLLGQASASFLRHYREQWQWLESSETAANALTGFSRKMPGLLARQPRL